MDNALLLTSMLVFLELFEALMQRSGTLYGVMEKLYGWYSKSIFLFFLMHPAFYFILFVVVATNTLNIYMIAILTLKIFDLFYKLELIKKIFIKQDVPQDLVAMLEWQIPSWFFLMGVLLYPPLLYYGLIA
ncbi:hypothetical protein [Sulfurovum riftiae]|uniref:Uncharacterized protein n=1 Tax=Sulfurovum riftiae TaxID=1630136 RepID=A0A151CFK0_9BACT|nr:hypothetical protein [Sulfurovum riftiae]KYJ86308.1 hypothetical protein AS592_05795 [Sulfurovum riftiae]